jgi:hypothetical protein
LNGLDHCTPFALCEFESTQWQRAQSLSVSVVTRTLRAGDAINPRPPPEGEDSLEEGMTDGSVSKGKGHFRPKGVQ